MNHVPVGDGVRLYVEDFGEGSPIVFICGGNLTHRSWDSQVAALAGRFRTIAFDWRGTGASDKPRGGYTVDIAARDLQTLIEECGSCSRHIGGTWTRSAFGFARRSCAAGSRQRIVSDSRSTMVFRRA